MRSYASRMAEPMELLPREERIQRLEEAGYNVFNLASSDVFIDLLSDSGTGTMSQEQWAAIMRGDEAYAGSRSFDRLADAVRDVMGFDYVVPAHQGRGAENVLFGVLVEEGDTVLSNAHFDTTRAHVANNGGDPVDCPLPAALEKGNEEPFKGDMDLDAAREVVEERGADAVSTVVLTATNNSVAGQPVSMENTRAVRAFCDEIDATMVIDACRFAENAYFIQQREDGYTDVPVAEIVREQLGYADALTMSAKKDGIANMGGFVALADGGDLYERCRQRAILYEGFTTYGGMSGRAMEAVAVGLQEAAEDAYVAHRVGQVQELGELLTEAGVPIYEPVGGHAVYIDAGEVLPHLSRDVFPGQALVCALYREGGIRPVELGGFAFPGTDRPDFVRLALPRRTYHREHLEHIAETAREVYEARDEIRGLRIVDEPAMEEIRHFSAELEPVED